MLAPRSIGSAALSIMGAAVLLLGSRTSGGLDLIPAGDTPVAAASSSNSGSSTTTAVEHPEGIHPVRIRIPAIGVDATMIDLGMLSPTEMETPRDFDHAGWLTLSREPGEIGPAVIAGHVDSLEGPAVFYRLRELAPGDEIVVEGADGEVRTFVVEDRGQYPKDSLPPEVFSFDQNRPELRLITCGGSFDRSARHYRDNVVVYAALSG